MAAEGSHFALVGLLWTGAGRVFFAGLVKAERFCCGQYAFAVASAGLARAGGPLS